MSREKAIRLGVYAALNSINITVDNESFAVPVYDSKVENDDSITSNMYIILADQFSTNQQTMSGNFFKSNITIEIYHKQQESATFDYVDEIGEVIENRIILSNDRDLLGITQSDGWKISGGYLNSSSNVKLQMFQGGAGVITNKTMLFTFTIIKQ